MKLKDPAILYLLSLVLGISPAITEEVPATFEMVLQTPPAEAVNGLRVSPDGSLLATASGEGGVRLYRASTGALVRVLGDAGDRAVVFSPDGKTLAAAGFHMDKLVGLYDVATGSRVRSLAGHTEWETYSHVFSPDGALLASAGSDGQVLVWDLSSGEIRHRILNPGSKITVLAFSPDSATLAGGGEDRAIHLWDSKTGRKKAVLEGHPDWVCALAFSPDGEHLAAGSCDWGTHRGHDWPRPMNLPPEECEWRVWEVASRNVLRSVKQPGRLISLAFSPDGSSIVGGVNREVLMWDIAGELPGRALTEHEGLVNAVAFTSDGGAVFSGGHDQRVHRVALGSGELEYVLPGSYEQVNSVAVSHEGNLLVTGSGDRRYALGKIGSGSRTIEAGAVRLWEFGKARMLRRLEHSLGQVMAVAVSPDGRRVAAVGTGFSEPGSTRVWEAATGEADWMSEEDSAIGLAVAFSPDSKWLATGDSRGGVLIRDARTGVLQRALEGPEEGAASVAFSPDGNEIACGDGTGCLHLWEVATGKLLNSWDSTKVLESPSSGDRTVTSIGFNPEGTLLAFCAVTVNNLEGEPVRFWNTRTGKVDRRFSDPLITGRPMALSPDGKLLATGGKTVRLWDASTGKLVGELFGWLKRTQSIVFSQDGRHVVSGGSYGTTNIWEVSSGRLFATLFGFSHNPEGRPANDWLAYGPDGTFDGSSGIDRYLAWRHGGEFLTSEQAGKLPHGPRKGDLHFSLDGAAARSAD
jgi:WD40 repeat protein